MIKHPHTKNTHSLANGRETLLKSFFLHKRTFNAVHDDVHDLKQDSGRQKTSFKAESASASGTFKRS